jgi:hypothetical protein
VKLHERTSKISTQIPHPRLLILYWLSFSMMRTETPFFSSVRAAERPETQAPTYIIRQAASQKRAKSKLR